MYADNTLKPVYDNQPYVAPNGTRYGPDYPKGEISALHKVTETTRPNDGSVVTGFTINSSFVQVWTTRAPTSEELENYIVQQGQALENGPLTYDGFEENGDEGQRSAAKEVIDFWDRLKALQAANALPQGVTVPTEISWDGTYGVQTITYEKILGWLLAIGFRRQKRFAVQVAMKTAGFDQFNSYTAALSQFNTLFGA